MLVLTRRPQQSIMIGDEIEIRVLSSTADKVRIGIQAPPHVRVFRKEIYLEIQQQHAAGDAATRAEIDEALRRLSNR